MLSKARGISRTFFEKGWNHPITMKTIPLNDERREALVQHLQTLFASEFDETLSAFRASEIIDVFLTTLGPVVYNQAVQDTRAHLQGKLDDLDGEIYADGKLT